MSFYVTFADLRLLLGMYFDAKEKRYSWGALYRNLPFRRTTRETCEYWNEENQRCWVRENTMFVQHSNFCDPCLWNFVDPFFTKSVFYKTFDKCWARFLTRLRSEVLYQKKAYLNAEWINWKESFSNKARDREETNDKSTNVRIYTGQL